jgi:ribose 5-phosphate isomerase A
VDRDREKQLAADAAAELVEGGMRVGLGTGSTVTYLLTALSRRAPAAVYVASSPRTEQAARALGLLVEPFDHLDRLDLAIDGADQVAPDWWLVKGGGGAHTREKVVAAAADAFVVIVDSTKLVDALAAPVPLELLSFGLRATLRHLADATLRDAPRTPDGGVLADWHGTLDDPGALATYLSGAPGVVEHGLVAPGSVTKVLVGRGDSTTSMTPGGAS